jgi:hypothetical protein
MKFEGSESCPRPAKDPFFLAARDVDVILSVRPPVAVTVEPISCGEGLQGNQINGS